VVTLLKEECELAPHILSRDRDCRAPHVHRRRAKRSAADVFRDRIRDKDKDPSFAAKQGRARHERIWAEINEGPAYGMVI
jgi:hypothetical protein